MRRRTGAGEVPGTFAAGGGRGLDLPGLEGMNWLVHHTKRVLRITSGILLLVLGLILMVPGVPGPGLLLIFLGLSVLAVDYVWAHQLNTYLKGKAEKVVSKVRRQFQKETPAKKL